MGSDYQFKVYDYIVGSVVVLVPVAIGVLFAVRDKDKATREEYLLGGRDMHLLPVAMSIFITFMVSQALRLYYLSSAVRLDDRIKIIFKRHTAYG